MNSCTLRGRPESDTKGRCTPTATYDECYESPIYSAEMKNWRYQFNWGHEKRANRSLRSNVGALNIGGERLVVFLS